VPELSVPGEHNRQNAALALAIVEQLVADKERAKEALANFAGTWRRFEYKGKTAKGALVYDDYAHHPTAIRAAIKGVRERFSDAKILAVFESHTYSRTQSLMDEFASALASADEVIIAPIYPAREEPIAGVTHEVLAERTRVHNPHTHTTHSLQEAAEQAAELADSGDIILLLGAGELFMQAPRIVVHEQKL
jgi:UDP-N-acetylmuramate--alanine ligase